MLPDSHDKHRTERESAETPPDDSNSATRREFLDAASGVGMGLCLAAGYGTFAAMGIRYLYPDEIGAKAWQFVCTADHLPVGGGMEFTTPGGARVNVTRLAEGAEAESYLALSSVCPHLGCRVHWEPQNDRFFCPCHNGAFDRAGNPTQGPPKDGNQPLTRYPLRMEAGLLLIEVPLESIAALPADVQSLACRPPDRPEVA